MFPARVRMSGLLQDKKVLITGSSRGIGRATAIAMAREGADVVIHYRRDADAAQAAAEAVRALGREALVVRAEMEVPEDIDAMFDHVAQAWGRLDVFVANAAATAFKPVTELKWYHLDRTYHVVVHSVLQSAQRCIPLMQGRGGRILTISSPGSRFALPRYAAIGTAKAALEALTRYLAAELGPYGITVNCLAPGVVETDSVEFYAKDRYDTFRDHVIAHTPLGRLTKPEDVADVAVLMASEKTRFITGQVIPIDGGLSVVPGGFEGV